MKKIACIAIAAMIAAAPVYTDAVSNKTTYTEKEMKRFEKNAEKQAKSTAKRFKKEGWVLNGTGDVEMKVMNHMLRTSDFGGDGYEVIGNGQKAAILSRSTATAMMDAALKYSRNCGMALKEKIVGEGNLMTDEERDTFIDAYEARVAQEIKGELRPTLELYRKAKDGSFETMVLYVVDYEGANQAQQRALKAELERNRLTHEVAKQISEFVNE